MPKGVKGLIDPKTKRKRESVSAATAKERLARLQKQNAKLDLDIGKAKENLVPAETIMSRVKSANTLVKTRLLAIPNRVAPQLVGLAPAAIAEIIRAAIVEAVNELAYEQMGRDQEQSTGLPEPEEYELED